MLNGALLIRGLWLGTPWFVDYASQRKAGQEGNAFASSSAHAYTHGASFLAEGVVLDVVLDGETRAIALIAFVSGRRHTGTLYCIAKH